MDRRPLALSGLNTSVLGLGCRSFGSEIKDIGEVKNIVDAAIDVGINFLDTAVTRGSREVAEELLGRSLGSRRPKLILSTSFGGEHGLAQVTPGATRYRYIRSSVEASLRRLKTDCIDVYQQYMPDDALPLEELLYTLEVLTNEGKLRHFGVAAWETWRFVEASSFSQMVGLAGLTTRQVPYSLLNRTAETEAFPSAKQWETAIIAYDPFAGTLLLSDANCTSICSDKAHAYCPETRVKALREFARQRDVRLADVALAAVASRPAVSCVLIPVPSAAAIENSAAALRWTPTTVDLHALDAIAPPGTSVLDQTAPMTTREPEI